MTPNGSKLDIIASRREEVAHLRVRGWSSRRIAARLGVSHVTVCADLKAIEAEWQVNAQADIAEHKANQLAELRAVAQRAWDDGDLDKVLRSLKQQAQLIGSDAPEKREHLTPLPVSIVEVPIDE